MGRKVADARLQTARREAKMYLAVSAFSKSHLAPANLPSNLDRFDWRVLRALYYMVFAIGGVGYSVPLGLLFAGISVPSGFMRLLPKWMVIFGMLLAICGELSWLSLVFPKLLYMIPLTRFPGFIWMIIAGFLLPKAKRA
jgi:hypothetical protein